MQTDAEAALQRCAELSATANAAVRSVAKWAEGRALLELGDAAGALASLGLAVRLASNGTDRAWEGRTRMSHALALAESGKLSRAIRELDRAAPMLSGAAAARLTAQRALVLYHAGRYVEALVHANAAVRTSTRLRDELGALRARLIRSVISLQSGDLVSAERDLHEAQQAASAQGQLIMLSGILGDLALIKARRGDIPDALRHFEESARRMEELGAVRSLVNLLLDQAECLLSAGLAADAAGTLATAESLARTTDLSTAATEAALLRAVALERAGDSVASARIATTAAGEFRRNGSPGWAAYAEYVALEAAAADPDVSLSSLRPRTQRAVSNLRTHGWAVEADQAVLSLALREVRGGKPDRAQRLLAEIPMAKRRGSVSNRVRAHVGEASVCVALADAAGAGRAIRAGLTLAEHQVSLAASQELRGALSTSAALLASLQTELAVATGDARKVFVSADRWCSWTVSTAERQERSAAPDREMIVALEEIREGHRRVRALEPGSAEFASARRGIERAERRASTRSRQLGRHATSRSRTALDVERFLHRLGARTFVEFVAPREQLLAICLDQRDGARLVELGASAPVAALLADLDGSLAGARRRGRTTSRLDDTLQELDDLVISPLGLRRNDVVVVPTGGLASTPWGLLPSLRDVSVTVAASAADWASVVRQRPAAARVGAVAGPDLPGAEEEVEALGRVLGAQTLTGSAASVAACLDLAGRVDVLHVASHGVHRPESPAMSALLLADGPLHVLDLGALRRVPRVVVLSACDVGRGEQLGTEVLGFAHALLALGVHHVIAPVVAIHDEATAPVMMDLHGQLARGARPPQALAAVRTEQRHDDVRLAAGSFVCLGRA